MNFIPYGRQEINDDDINEVIDVLKSKFITTGPKVKEFEKAICNYCNCKYSVVVSNGTAALHLASLVLLKENDKVLTTPNSFLATSNAILYVKAKPIFVDIEGNGNIDLDLCEEELQKDSSIKAIYAVAFSGNMLNQKKLKYLKDKYNILILEDCAHAIGASFDEVKAGSCVNSDCSIFSFHPVKHLTTGEGGAITTNSKELNEKLIMLRNHGMYPKYYHAMVGGNFRIDALQAALLRKKLPHLDSYGEARAENAGYYLEEFAELDSDQVTLPLPGTAEEGVIWNQFTLKVHGRRDELKAHLLESQVGCEIYYPVPLHQQECFSHLEAGALPVAEKLASEALSIPVFGELGEERRERVVEVVKSFFKS